MQVQNPDFDYIFFKMNFDTGFIDEKILDDEEFKQHILTISYNYQLNEEEMKDVILKTITVDKDLKYEDISKNARIYYQKKNKKTSPSFSTKQPDAFINSMTDDATYRFLDRLEKMTPEQLLMDLNGGMKPSVSELKLFEDLLNNTKFSETMIKIMFLLVSHEKDGVLPGYNYFEKIANTWARAGLKTPQDVINYINKGPERGKKTYERKKRQVKLPDWYGEYEEQLGSLPQDESLSDNEIEQVLEEAKKLL